MSLAPERHRRLLVVARTVDGDDPAAVRARALLRELPDHGWRVTAVTGSSAPAADPDRPPSSRVLPGLAAASAVEQERPAALMSLGPPMAVHLAAYAVRVRTRLPWLASFDDVRAERATRPLQTLVTSRANRVLLGDGRLALAGLDPDRTIVAAPHEVRAVALMLDYFVGRPGGTPTAPRPEPNVATSASASRTSAG